MLAKTLPSILTSQAKVVPLSQSQAKLNGNVASSSSSRPAWALTESAAVTADEERLQDDEDDLLSFAESLDFDQYIGDMEVRTMMDGLRHRIAEMEKEVAMEEERDGASEERAVKREHLAMMVRYYQLLTIHMVLGIEQNFFYQSLQNSFISIFCFLVKIDEAMTMGAQQLEKSQLAKDIAAARCVLQSDEGSELNAVHSNKSVTAMIKSSRDKILTDVSEPKILHNVRFALCTTTVFPAIKIFKVQDI